MIDAANDPHRRVHEVLDVLWAQLTHAGSPDVLLTAEVHLPTSGGPLRVGRDVMGLPHLLVPLANPATSRDLRDTDGISVRERVLLVEELPVRFVDLACTRHDLIRVFAALAVDICVRLAATVDEPDRTVTEVIDEWRSLLERRPSQWTRARCAGTFAELRVLRRVLDVDPHAIDVWTGPDGQAQDFRGPLNALEVKATVGGEGRAIRIHGSDQLEEPAGGTLYLAWFRLDDATPTGTSLREELAHAGSSSSGGRAWARQLARLALPAEEHPEVDGRRFRIVEERWYRVGDGFPRIVPGSFTDGALPGGVGGIEYLVDLDAVPADLMAEPDGVPLEILAVP